MNWREDILLGVRLAMAGGRSTRSCRTRLLLAVVGTGLATAVLLVAAAVGPAIQTQQAREEAVSADTTPRPGVDPLVLRNNTTAYRGKPIVKDYVSTSGPNSPVPPGLSRLPGPGEVVLSPALAELLASPEGELLRPRYPERVIGTITDEGLTTPHVLTSYAGAVDRIDARDARVVFGFGGSGPSGREVSLALLALLVVGLVVLVLPVLVFVGTSARLGGAERDRRLATLRLLGADARQLRRIAAAESLVGAVAGLAVGTGLFLVLRQFAPNLRVRDVSFFPGDVTPTWPLALLVALAVPALAVVTAQLALQNVVVAPLGTVRSQRPPRRRLWWRLTLIALGGVLLFAVRETGQQTAASLPMLVMGAMLVLIGVPALLPWLVDRAVRGFRGGGGPAVQLALRRLQADSGTPTRVIAGLTVVLTGAIALQAVLTSQEDTYGVDEARPGAVGSSLRLVVADRATADQVVPSLRRTPGVTGAYAVGQGWVKDGDGETIRLYSGDCADLQVFAAIDRCADGDVFFLAGYALGGRNSGEIDAERVGRMRSPRVVTTVDGDEVELGPVRLPAVVPGVSERSEQGTEHPASLLMTHAALGGVRLDRVEGEVFVRPDQPDALEHARNSVAGFGWRASVVTQGWARDYSVEQATFRTIRAGLLAGALFALVLAGLSLVVFVVDQVRERRRAVAALTASGVPPGMLARSVLWQMAIPILLAVSAAVLAGLLMSLLMFRLTGAPVRLDWAAIATLAAGAVVLVLVVTAAALPTLRSATRQEALRVE